MTKGKYLEIEIAFSLRSLEMIKQHYWLDEVIYPVSSRLQHTGFSQVDLKLLVCFIAVSSFQEVIE